MQRGEARQEDEQQQPSVQGGRHHAPTIAQ
jgi:hypothetical protein